MELRQLRYFSAVCEEGSITRAARFLNIAQPALSRQISDLEEEIGYPLLNRLSRGVETTDAGRAFLEDVNRIISDLDNARARGAAVASGQVYHVRIGVVGDGNIAKFDFVLQGLRAYARRYPQATIRLKSHNTWESMNRSIAEAELDVAFTYGGASFRDHRSILIQREKLVLAVPAAHRLASAKQVSIADLKDENLIWHARSAAVRMHDQLIEQFRNHGLEPKIAFELENPHLALHIVRTGLGCAFVTSAVGLRNDLEGIALKIFSDFDFEVELQLAWSGQSEAARHFVDVYKAMVPDHQKEMGGTFAGVPTAPLGSGGEA